MLKRVRRLHRKGAREMKAEKSMSKDVLLAANKNRRLIYAFLSKMYEKEITTDLLKELSGEKNPMMQFMVSNDEELRRGLETLSEYLKDLKKRNLEQARLELAVEYANLFLGVKGKPLHPSESVYVNEDHVMYQEARDRVQSIYWNAGVDKKKEYTEPEDHIAIELQFMEYLCRKTVEALEKDEEAEAIRYLRIQKDFLDVHLAKWVPKLTKDIMESADVDFYKGVACITDAFIVLDEDAISSSLDEMKSSRPR
jgi:TorA maturation chaperone TorD